jgi:LDH2 family malate/lactate/ureidoglycolate dehydrogenase
VNTPPRSVRIPDHIWRAARERAEREGTTVTAVILRALTRYGQGPRVDQERR